MRNLPQSSLECNLFCLGINTLGVFCNSAQKFPITQIFKYPWSRGCLDQPLVSVSAPRQKQAEKHHYSSAGSSCMRRVSQEHDNPPSSYSISHVPGSESHWS